MHDLNDMFYNDAYQRQQHLAYAKDLLDSIKHYADPKKNILALGRSWMSDALLAMKADVTVLPDNIDKDQRFDVILALDEILTREPEEQAQKKLITQIVGLLKPQGTLIASLRDYKNGGYHKRPLGDTISAKINDHRFVITEVNEIDNNDKQRWFQKIYVVEDDESFVCLEAGHRRTLYFKQFAKYCADAGCDSFGTFKNQFWRGHLRRTLEHLVYARAR